MPTLHLILSHYFFCSSLLLLFLLSFLPLSPLPDYEPTNMLCIPLKSKRTSAGTVSVVGVAVLYDKIGGR